MTNRTALFIDGSNLYAAGKALGIDVDFKRLRKFYSDGLVRAYYYTAIREDEAFVSIRPLIDYLEYNGYTLVSKPTKEFALPDGRVKIKGNMDCEIAVDAMKLSFNRAIDHAVFFTGDGDFKPLILAIQDYGVRVTVVSTIRTQPSMCADELRRVADTFVDLVDISKAIDRPEDERPRSRYAAS